MESQTKQCQNCHKDFVIEPEDFAFYDKISAKGGSASGGKVPPPTFCPECRMIRRMMFRNERALYKRKCDAPGHNEEIISIYHKDSPFKVYDQKYWWSDEWDPMEYGRNYDFNRPFFEQFKELLKIVPANNLIVKNNINCDYVNWLLESKDCYIAIGGGHNENILYSNHIFASKDSIDSYFVDRIELCYDNVICQNSYHLFYSQDCNACLDSYFLYDCKNCSNCFGCVGLRNKQYYIFNIPQSKNDYEKKIKEFNLGDFNNIFKFKHQFEETKLKYPHKFINAVKTEEVSGDNIREAKNCKYAFDILNGGSENCKFVFWAGVNMKDIYDCMGGVNAELLYEGVSVVENVSRVIFSSAIWTGHNIYYSYNCHNSSNLFGCVGLRHKQYCILNKQYTPEEYKYQVSRIMKHMNEMPYISRKKSEILNPKSETPKDSDIASEPTGQANSNELNLNTQTEEIVYRYGEFFPPELSPFCYNETIAQEYFPLTKEQAIEKGYTWKEPDERDIRIEIKTEDLPDHIKDVKDDILGKVIQCAHAEFINIRTPDVLNINNPSISGTSGVPELGTSDVQRLESVCNEQCTTAFKIIEPELAFYRKMNLPLPRLCPNCRHYQRIKQRNPLKLWKRRCMCNSDMRQGTSNNNMSHVAKYQNTAVHFHGNQPCPNEFETTYAPERPEIVYCEACYLKEVV